MTCLGHINGNFYYSSVHLMSNFSLSCILVPWCKCHVSIHIYFQCPIVILNVRFSGYHFIVYCWPCLESYVKLYNWYAIYYLLLLVHNGTIIVRKKLGPFQLFCCPFHSLILRSTILIAPMHGCPLRNQNDNLDNPIPCKLTFVGVLNMEY